MSVKKIIVIDSGVGGLHILKECQELMPHINFIYVADTFNSPYGEKSKKQLKDISLNLLKNLEKTYNPIAFVIACNTLTVNCVKYLRQHIKTQIFGIEPALKQAKINGGETILFATKQTIKQYSKLNKKIVRQLKQEYKNQGLIFKNYDKVYKLYIPNLPSLIDNNIENLNQIRPILEKRFAKYDFKNINNLVLGCTHFIALKPLLKEIIGRDVEIFDGAKAVANHTYSVLISNKDSIINQNNKICYKEKEEQKETTIDNETNIQINNKNCLEDNKKDIENDIDIERVCLNSLSIDKVENFLTKKINKVTFLTTDANPCKKNKLKKYYLKIIYNEINKISNKD